MRARLPFILLLVSVMVALTTLAYVETPDQVWLGGFYDEDADDRRRTACGLVPDLRRGSRPQTEQEEEVPSTI